MSDVLLWALGTGVIGVVFARALHRWADRRTGVRRAARLQERLGTLARLDLTPTPYLSEITPRTPPRRR